MDESKEETKRIKKPNLRSNDPYLRQKKILFLGCFLVGLYIYPTILRPLFNIGLSEQSDSKEKKELLDKLRPSFMPEWSSPFARKQDD